MALLWKFILWVRKKQSQFSLPGFISAFGYKMAPTDKLSIPKGLQRATVILVTRAIWHKIKNGFSIYKASTFLAFWELLKCPRGIFYSSHTLSVQMKLKLSLQIKNKSFWDTSLLLVEGAYDIVVEVGSNTKSWATEQMTVKRAKCDKDPTETNDEISSLLLSVRSYL